MQSPILFRKPRIEKRIRAALADAADYVPGEFEKTTRTWFLHGKPWISAETVIELANTDFVETTLGGVVVRFVLHGERGDTFHQAQETAHHILPATRCNNNEQDRPVAHENTELPPPTPTLLEFGTSEHAIKAGPPASTPPSSSGQTDRETIASSPPSSSSQVEKAAIAEVVVADSLGRIDHDCSSSFKHPPLSSSNEIEVSSPPTPPLSPPPASVSMDDLHRSSPVEPTPLALLPPVVADKVVVDGSIYSRNDDGDDFCGDDSSTVYKTPPLCSSNGQGSPASPTPPLSSPSASSMDEPSPSIETPSLTLPPPLVPPPPSLPKTFGANPLGEMFSSSLDQSGVISVITDILCSTRVMNDHKKAVRVLADLESGCVRGENMEWVVRGLNTLRAKRELKQRHGGRVFVGPRYGAPLYKTGNGVRRLLRGVASKHGAGTKFVVCVTSSSGKATDDGKMITGIVSPAPAPAPTPAAAAQAPACASGTVRVEPVMDGDVPGLRDWSNIRGNLDGGCRLWAWAYQGGCVCPTIRSDNE